MSTYIKVCGLTQVENTRMVVKAGVDAVGLNFFPQSKRYVDTATAKSLRACIPDGVDVVGVFVNSPREDVIRITTEVGLTAIQFHGDESAEEILAIQRECPSVKMLRAVRLSDDNKDATLAAVEQLKDVGVNLSAVLVDAFVVGEFGGTGHQLDHDLIRRLPANWPPLIVAGGLTPDNVADCVQAVSPWGVDVASGVESEPGIKSPEKTRQFISAVQGAITSA